jgi:hypothetical protein
LLLGGLQYFQPGDLDAADILIPLEAEWRQRIARSHGREFILRPGQQVLELFLIDFGGLPGNWEEQLRTLVLPVLEQGKSVLGFCIGSHGRSGTLAASLIALLESEDETPDPIVAARQRHCLKSVETLPQAEGIFALRRKKLPDDYLKVFLAD